MAKRVARVYLPKPTTVIELPWTMTPILLFDVVNVKRGGTTTTGTVTMLGPRPIVTTLTPVGPGRVKVETLI